MPALPHSSRSWLPGLLAGLLALAAIVAPAQHGRMALGRAVAALAMVDAHGPHAGHGAPAKSQHEHLAAPACLACVLVAAPGLPAAAFAGMARLAVPEAGAPVPHTAPAVGRPARSARYARAPPAIPA